VLGILYRVVYMVLVRQTFCRKNDEKGASDQGIQ